MLLSYLTKECLPISLETEERKTIYNDLQMELRSPNNPAKRAER